MKSAKTLLSVLLAVVITMSAGVSTIASAAAATGWQKDSHGWWYKTSNGYYKNSWANIGGKWYWFNSNGYMQTNWKAIEGKWYLFSRSGDMLTGWAFWNNAWYFMDYSGAMKTGWVYSGGNWYYMNSSGAMMTNITIDGWKIDASGVAKQVSTSNNKQNSVTVDKDVYKEIIVETIEKENVKHEHTYIKNMIEPTCFSDGYTVYICHCGNMYKDDYVDASHAYRDGVCTKCGERKTDYVEYEKAYERLTKKYDEDIEELESKIEESEKSIEESQRSIYQAQETLNGLSSVCPEWYKQQFLSNWQQYGSTYDAVRAANENWGQEYYSQKTQLNNTISMGNSYIQSEMSNIQLYEAAVQRLLYEYNREVAALKLKYNV